VDVYIEYVCFMFALSCKRSISACLSRISLTARVQTQDSASRQYMAGIHEADDSAGAHVAVKQRQ